MKQIKEEFVETQIDRLKQREDVKAVAAVGSYARNPEGEHNDLDLYAVVEDDWRKRVTEEVEGVVVEKFFNSMDWSKEYLEGEDWWRNCRWFTTADIRYDEDNFFNELEQEAQKTRK